MNNNYTINEKIKDHEINVDCWEHQGKAEFLYLWFDIFNDAFFQKKLEQCILSFEQKRTSILGHYVLEYNGIGIINNIGLNSRHLGRKKWELLETLLHEMVHQYQRRLGSFSDKCPNKNRGSYHNKEFLTMMESFGLFSNKRGQPEAAPTGKFVELLKENGIEIVEKELKLDLKKPTSKLKKYSCECTPAINIRVGISEFSANCNICKNDFELQE